VSDADRDRSQALPRRIARLHQELTEEAVPLPIEGPSAAQLLEEVLYARQPPLHERKAPRYGALVFVDGPARWERSPACPTLVDVRGIEPAFARRLADGRASFLVVEPDGISTLACFEHSIEYEATIGKMHESTGAIVVQRTAQGKMRICAPSGIVEWDTVWWTIKPFADRYAAPILRLTPQADPTILQSLLELCVHWLSAGGVGTTLVWYLTDVGRPGDPGGDRDFERVDLSRSLEGPALSAARYEHFAPLLSALGQMDRAAVVLRDGSVARFGVALAPTDGAAALVGATGGTRHTSARRFSFDEPRALVFVVSEDGPVTVFSDGATAAVVRADPCRTGFRLNLLQSADPAGERTIRCPRCKKLLLVDEIRFERWQGGPERLPCPVCAEEIIIDAYRAAIRGVRKEL
jgi:DisA bacterial checkpoint controller nucleotide-binding